MYIKWWKSEPNTRPECESYNDKTLNSLDLSKLGGIFVIVIIVLFAALISAIIEFCWRAKRIARTKV